MTEESTMFCEVCGKPATKFESGYILCSSPECKEEAGDPDQFIIEFEFDE